MEVQLDTLSALVCNTLRQALPEEKRHELDVFGDDAAYAASLVLPEDQDRARFGGTSDGSIHIHAGFELALKLCTIAMSNPLAPDIDAASEALREADEYLDGWRDEQDKDVFEERRSERERIETAGAVR